MTPTTEQMTTALRNARIGLAMWGMATPEIDALIGPMSEEDRELARRGRGGAATGSSCVIIKDIIKPLPTSPDGVSIGAWWNDDGVLRPGTLEVQLADSQESAT
jgi:hypothetical protein